MDIELCAEHAAPLDQIRASVVARLAANEPGDLRLDEIGGELVAEVAPVREALVERLMAAVAQRDESADVVFAVDASEQVGCFYVAVAATEAVVTSGVELSVHVGVFH